MEALKGDLAKLDQDLKERGTDFFYGKLMTVRVGIS